MKNIFNKKFDIFILQFIYLFGESKKIFFNLWLVLKIKVFKNQKEKNF